MVVVISTMDRSRRLYSGRAKVEFCRKMATEDWLALADLFEIALHDRQRFKPGFKPRDLWELVEGRGRLHELEGYLYEQGLGHVVIAMREAEPPGLRPPPLERQCLDTLFFDLRALRDEVLKAADQQGPVLCIALPHRDGSVGDKMLEWLPYYFPGIECKSKRSLGPLFKNVKNLTDWLGGFRDELDSTDVGVHVDASRTTDVALANLTTRVHEVFHSCQCRLVLLATVNPACPVSNHVIRLSTPCFRRPDLADWTQRILPEHGLPLTLSQTLADMVYEYAAETEDELDPHRTYQMLESYIADLRDDPASFRRQLEQRSQRARPTD